MFANAATTEVDSVVPLTGGGQSERHRVILITCSQETEWYGREILEGLGCLVHTANPETVMFVRSIGNVQGFDHAIIDASSTDEYLERSIVAVKSHHPNINIVIGVSPRFQDTHKLLGGYRSEVNSAISIPFSISKVAEFLKSHKLDDQDSGVEGENNVPTKQERVVVAAKRSARTIRYRDSFLELFEAYYHVGEKELPERILEEALLDRGKFMFRIIRAFGGRGSFQTEKRHIASALNQYDLQGFRREIDGIDGVNRYELSNVRKFLGLRVSVAKLIRLSRSVAENAEHESVDLDQNPASQ